MKQILLPLFLLAHASLFAQPVIEWQKKFGGGHLDFGISIQNTPDDGYIMIGSTASNDGDITGQHGESYDVWVLKTDANGAIQWQKTYGGSDWDNAFFITQTSDGGYFFVGSTSSKDGDVQSNSAGGNGCWAVKLDAQGNIQWERAYGTTSSSEDGVNAAQTADGGYLLAGSRDEKYWLLKIDSTGNIKWEHNYGGSIAEELLRMLPTTDGGSLLMGRSYSTDGDITGHHGGNTTSDYWVVKVDQLGAIQWEKSLGGSNDDVCYGGIQAADGAYLLFGITASNDGDVHNLHGVGKDDAWVVKLDTTGNLLWEKTLGGTQEDLLHSLLETPNGNIIGVGRTSSNDGDITSSTQGNRDAWMVNLSKNGVLQWQTTFGGSEDDEIRSLIPASDGGYVFLGITNSTDGDVQQSGFGLDDFWMGKLSAVSGTLTPEISLLNVFPNPTSGVFSIASDARDPIISLRVIDLLGKVVLDKQPNSLQQLDISALPAGVYQISGKTNEGQTLQGKVLKH